MDWLKFVQNVQCCFYSSLLSDRKCIIMKMTNVMYMNKKTTTGRVQLNNNREGTRKQQQGGYKKTTTGRVQENNNREGTSKQQQGGYKKTTTGRVQENNNREGTRKQQQGGYKKTTTGWFNNRAYYVLCPYYNTNCTLISVGNGMSTRVFQCVYIL